MAAEKENGGGLESANGLGSMGDLGLKVQRRGPGHYSSQGVVSEDDFNINDVQNQKLNEEIQKLLEENRKALE